MNKLQNLGLIILVFAVMFAPVCAIQVRGAGENLKTFLDTEMPGLTIEVNATKTIHPGENITTMLTFRPSERMPADRIDMTHFNLSIFAFYNGTEKVLIGNVVDDSFTLITESRTNTSDFQTPLSVWGVTYGEIILTYSAVYGDLTVAIENLTCGFTMTLVENTYLRQVEEQLGTLNSTLNLLNQTFRQVEEQLNTLNSTVSLLNQIFWESFHLILSHDSLTSINSTYWGLQQNYTNLQSSVNDLDNTRRVAAILGITTAFFVITTFYVVMRRPKEHW